MSARRLPGRILALTPGAEGAVTADEIVRRARDAVAVGVDSILLREPAWSDRATLDLARELRAVLGTRGWLAIHDRVHLAAAAEADAVHLGHRSLSIAAARAIVHEHVAVGFSAHAHDDPSAWSGADYLLYGPVYATPSKAGLLEPVGVEGLARAVASTRIPIHALGGIGPEHVEALESAGCRGVAARGSLLGARGPYTHWSRAEFASIRND